ncbi:MAG: hypothetical protein M1834_004582 [Cirrosporium novae-zelandiae]|nr:MAG: hypothetical protein M1834_004582 [Cirrosporium novae-zelandiae]
MSPLELIFPFFIIFLSRCVYLIYFHPLSAYPGPLLAKLTNFWSLFIYLQGNQHHIHSTLHARYGTIVRAGPNRLLFSSLSAYRTIYGTDIRRLAKGDFYLLAGPTDDKRASSFATKNPDLHRDKRRKVVFTALTPRALMSYRPIIQKNVEHFISHLSENITSSSIQAKQKKEESLNSINIAPKLEKLTLQLLLKVIFGQTYNFIGSDHDLFNLISSRAKIVRLAFGLGLVPWLAQAFSKFRFNKLSYDTQGHPIGFTAVVDLAQTACFRKNQEDDDVKNMQESIIKNFLLVGPTTTTTDRTRKPTSDHHYFVLSETINMAFAGTASTAASLAAIIHELSLHPSWQDRILAELQTNTSNPSTIDPPISNPQPPPTPLLQAFIHESLRIHPPFPSPFEREIRPGGELLIPGIKGPLPVGTTVACNIYVICYSVEAYGDDAGEFKPERWLGGGGDEDYGDRGREKRRMMEDAWAVFSRGNRGCLGKELAMMILLNVISTVSTSPSP